ncbi:MAG TPA: cytidylate kinase-like family protein [Gemmatimonadales bacterium]|nr:cytidylate kinase-like family protein [Gemmatimonadales bacterium]
MLITISRQYGAGASEVARRVAEALGWSVVDNEIVGQVAFRAGLSPDEVAERDERCPGFVERLARTLATSSQEMFVPAAASDADLEEGDLVRITERVVEEIALQGRAVVIGRAAAAVLGQQERVLHVRIVAPKALRIRTVMERLGVDRKRAEQLVDDTDAHRARYHREYYHRDWDDPTLYHMILNTGALGLDGAAELVLARARRLGWGGPPDPGREAQPKPNPLP